jgi:hypothetical protein
MSKHNNVNPGQYKVAGRERQGEDVVASEHKAQLTQEQPDKKGQRPVRPDGSGAEKKAAHE